MKPSIVSIVDKNDVLSTIEVHTSRYETQPSASTPNTEPVRHVTSSPNTDSMRHVASSPNTEPVRHVTSSPNTETVRHVASSPNTEPVRHVDSSHNINRTGVDKTETFRKMYECEEQCATCDSGFTNLPVEESLRINTNASDTVHYITHLSESY